MTHLKQTLESRIISTLKMNPDMTWTEASDNEPAMATCSACDSLTAIFAISTAFVFISAT